ncbi:MAG: hypothetical protein KME64_24460 [Scytonematopsis contorta HA4267-MV1]|jgi:hypothetical protein|nr:hypothetical protein [Scytonematopsis contorta HA4267-MV1]
MLHKSLTVVLGVATAAVVVTAATPAQAQMVMAKIKSGVTSVSLDLPLLKSSGLNLRSTSSNVAKPASSDFIVGFNITSDSNFTFIGEDKFRYLGGTIEHLGSVTFNKGLTVGNFSIGFDQSRINKITSGFFVKDTLKDFGDVLFDIGNLVPQFKDKNLKISGDLLVSPELAKLLGSSKLTSVKVGKTQIDVITNARQIPESTAVLGLLAAAGVAAANKRRLGMAKS